MVLRSSRHILYLLIIATLIIIVFFKLTVKNLSLFPGKMQNFLEMLYTAFRGMIDDAMGEQGRKFLPVIATMGIFIAVSNLMGLLPELGSPTANLNVTVGCAFFVFVYYHYQGIRKHGVFGYLKTFMGPIWWLAILFVPIEIISHFSRPLSLSIRLYGNIFGEDMVIIIIASLVPFHRSASDHGACCNNVTSSGIYFCHADDDISCGSYGIRTLI